MPDRPARPGKHAARHKKPTRLERATQRLTPAVPAFGLRRTGGTVVALGAVVLAGAAGNGSTSDASGGSAAAERPQASARLPSPHATEGVAQQRAARTEEASRSATRPSLAQARAERRDHDPAAVATGGHTARAESTVPDDPRSIARQMMAEYGWGAGEYSCLDQLWISESNWDVDATNPTSGAYGIPQSLPAEKMASAGPDWRTNPATQIEWGLEYIDLSYGTPCSAWEFKQANNWY